MDVICNNNFAKYGTGKLRLAPVSYPMVTVTVRIRVMVKVVLGLGSKLRKTFTVQVTASNTAVIDL